MKGFNDWSPSVSDSSPLLVGTGRGSGGVCLNAETGRLASVGFSSYDVDVYCAVFRQEFNILESMKQDFDNGCKLMPALLSILFLVFDERGEHVPIVPM